MRSTRGSHRNVCGWSARSGLKGPHRASRFLRRCSRPRTRPGPAHVHSAWRLGDGNGGGPKGCSIHRRRRHLNRLNCPTRLAFDGERSEERFAYLENDDVELMIQEAEGLGSQFRTAPWNTRMAEASTSNSESMTSI